MKQYKIWVYKVFLIIISAFILIAVFNFVIDPFQFYRKSFYPVNFSTNQRFQSPGLAKNYNYNTIVIGSSVSENFLAAQIKKVLGFNALNLALSGSTIKEQNLILEVATNTKKVKNVIWGIDIFSLRGKPNAVRDDYGPFPYYFYNQNVFDDVYYLLNISIFKMSFHNFRSFILNQHVGENNDLENLNNWHTHYKFGKKFLIAKFQKKEQKTYKGVKTEEYSLENLKRNMDMNIIKEIKSNPNIDYYLFFPPYSVICLKTYYNIDSNIIKNWLEAKKYLYEQLSACNNVKIYDYNDDYQVISNLDNYKDSVHYSQKISDEIICNIKEDKGELNKENINLRFKIFLNYLKNYKIKDPELRL